MLLLLLRFKNPDNAECAVKTKPNQAKTRFAPNNLFNKCRELRCSPGREGKFKSKKKQMEEI